MPSHIQLTPMSCVLKNPRTLTSSVSNSQVSHRHSRLSCSASAMRRGRAPLRRLCCQFHRRSSSLDSYLTTAAREHSTSFAASEILDTGRRAITISTMSESTTKVAFPNTYPRSRQNEPSLSSAAVTYHPRNWMAQIKRTAFLS